MPDTRLVLVLKRFLLLLKMDNLRAGCATGSKPWNLCVSNSPRLRITAFIRVVLKSKFPSDRSGLKMNRPMEHAAAGLEKIMTHALRRVPAQEAPLLAW